MYTGSRDRVPRTTRSRSCLRSLAAPRARLPSHPAVSSWCARSPSRRAWLRISRSRGRATAHDEPRDTRCWISENERLDRPDPLGPPRCGGGGSGAEPGATRLSSRHIFVCGFSHKCKLRGKRCAGARAGRSGSIPARSRRRFEALECGPCERSQRSIAGHATCFGTCLALAELTAVEIACDVRPEGHLVAVSHPRADTVDALKDAGTPARARSATAGRGFTERARGKLPAHTHLERTAATRQSRPAWSRARRSSSPRTACRARTTRRSRHLCP